MVMFASNSPTASECRQQFTQKCRSFSGADLLRWPGPKSAKGGKHQALYRRKLFARKWWASTAQVDVSPQNGGAEQCVHSVIVSVVTARSILIITFIFVFSPCRNKRQDVTSALEVTLRLPRQPHMAPWDGNRGGTQGKRCCSRNTLLIG